ncbi:hypothetical protein LZ31DRAFT_185797 [Colletotrichum somersetense]|nr:hypothetical protein LZ31DRAFT_185797 [Colletotrichum somersetense]
MSLVHMADSETNLAILLRRWQREWMDYEEIGGIGRESPSPGSRVISSVCALCLPSPKRTVLRINVCGPAAFWHCFLPPLTIYDCEIANVESNFGSQRLGRRPGMTKPEHVGRPSTPSVQPCVVVAKTKATMLQTHASGRFPPLVIGGWALVCGCSWVLGNT